MKTRKDMAFSKLYHTLLSMKFFIDLREVDSFSVLLTKMLEHDVKDFSAEQYSDQHPLKIKMEDAFPQMMGSSTPQSEQKKIAIIPLHGTMIKYGTMCAYGADEIAAAIDKATDDTKVCGLVLDIDSGGGAVDAIAPLVDAISRAQASGKPVVASCDLAASAAYYVACHCTEVMANNNISSEFGSIGVMMSFPDYAKYYENAGIKVHTIYSNLSTYKNKPFELAKEGKYDLIKKEQLDPLARKFQETVKAKREGKLNDKVEGILSGRVFFAEEALKHGLIDAIGTEQQAVKRCRELVAEASIQDYINI